MNASASIRKLTGDHFNIEMEKNWYDIFGLREIMI